MRALERSPEERFATAADMLAAIEGAMTVASPARVAAVVRELVDGAAPVSVEARDVSAEIRAHRADRA